MKFNKLQSSKLSAIPVPGEVKDKPVKKDKKKLSPFTKKFAK